VAAERFIEMLAGATRTALCSAGATEQGVGLVAAAVGRALHCGRDLVPAAALVPDASRYRQTVLHVDTDLAFGIAALVWLPGQATPIHDHRSWCIVGVLEGEETEERFAPLQHDDLAGGVQLVGSGLSRPGSVQTLLPPLDIHRVVNAGPEVAVSIHVYGVDLAEVGSSIASTYPPPS
jgi:predicted metal-dependent enzyme (double-stranded beta helix superfamily)